MSHAEPRPGPQSPNELSAEPTHRPAVPPIRAEKRTPPPTVGSERPTPRPAVRAPRDLAARLTSLRGRPERSDDLATLAVKNGPAWLVSTLIHMLLIIVLGLLFVRSEYRQTVSLDVVLADADGNQLDQAVSIVEENSIAEEELITLVELPEVDDPFAAPLELEIVPDGISASSDIEAPRIGLALHGREDGMKQTLMDAYGATAGSERAVQNALAWLARQQRSNGSWSLKGPYRDGSSVENVNSATAMALLAFQGAGNSHEKGPFQKQVGKGIDYLLRQQDQEGCFFPDPPPDGTPGNNRLYTHGQCTIVMCELYAMTQDSRLREPAQKAIDFCVQSQDPRRGGWRYRPRVDSDTSVTGWIVMALQSAIMGGLDVPEETLHKVSGYLDQAANNDGSRYGYIPGSPPTESMTAEALLCRQYLGWSQTDDRLIKGAEYLLLRENLPKWDDRNVYHWYYATQVMHHMEGPFWTSWNGAMRDLLVDHQEVKGAEKGSWSPSQPDPDRWGFQGGRLYVTCLSVYILEVYYRHLPLYSSDVLTSR